MTRKYPKHEWFNPIRKERDRSTMCAFIFLYFGGLVAFIISIGYVYIEKWSAAFLFGFGGIWLTVMCAVFTNLRESNWLADKLDRMYYRTYSNLERDMKRRMRK